MARTGAHATSFEIAQYLGPRFGGFPIAVAIFNRLKFDAGLYRRGTHARLRSTVLGLSLAESGQFNSGTDSAQSDPSPALNL